MLGLCQLEMQRLKRWGAMLRAQQKGRAPSWGQGQLMALRRGPSVLGWMVQGQKCPELHQAQVPWGW